MTQIDDSKHSVLAAVLRDDVDEIRKTDPGQALDLLGRKAAAFAGEIEAGRSDRPTAMKLLWAIAVAAGLVERHGKDAVIDVLADGLTERARKALVVRRAADVEAQPVEWLWPGRIGVGKLTLVAGVPGLGKSQFAAFLAAAVSNNRPLPCAEGFAPQGRVIILSAEDDAADTIRPRLDAAGADPSRVLIISAVRGAGGRGRRAFNLQADLDLLERQIRKAGDVRLIVIDPISSYLGRVDSHKNAAVRTVLEPMAEMAARLRVAVLAVTHFTKGAAARAVDRVAGSIAFVAAARSAFMIVRDPADAERRLLVTLKSNVAADAAGLAFRIRGTVTGNVPTSVIEWEETRIEGSADAILAAAHDAHAAQSARAEAEEFLRGLLAGGEVAATEVRSAAMAAGVSWASVRRMQKALGVAVRRRSAGNVGGGHWIWSLPTGTTG